MNMTDDTPLATTTADRAALRKTGNAMLAAAKTPEDYVAVAAFASVARAAARKKKETGLANEALGVMLKADMGLADEIDKGQAAGIIATPGVNQFKVIPNQNNLSDVGVSAKQVHEGRKIRDHFHDDPRRIDATVAAAGEDEYLARLAFLSVHVGANSGENEWYTPPKYIAAAREVMGGIDLDPASSVKANSIVQADQFYTKADDGLAQEWSGRVWLNPPYENTLISRFADKVVDEYKRDRIEAACVLVNNASDTAWFLTLAKVANARCDFTKRITYLNADLKPENTPLQGQSLLYFGGDGKKFVAVFRSMGHCWFPA